MSSDDRYGVRGNAPESSITYSDLNREDAARDRRTDARSEMPTLAALQARRGEITANELMSRCSTAANLTAPEYIGTDHRADVAATLILRHVDSVGRVSDERATLRFLCGEARNLYRSITAELNSREDDRLLQAAIDANAPGQGMADPELAEKRAELRADDAYRAAGQLCRRLGFKALPDTPVWTALYCDLRDTTDEIVAAERRTTVPAVQRARQRGGEMVRAAYSAADLLAKLSDEPDDTTAMLRCAGKRTPAMAGAPDCRQRESEPTGQWTAHRGSGAPVGRAMPAEMKRAAFKWTRAEYRARMMSAGQGGNLAAEDDRNRVRPTKPSRSGGYRSAELLLDALSD